MTFIEFKKTLLDANISLPKFSALIKVSEKNIQAYKKKGEVPNTIAVIARSFAEFEQQGFDYRGMVETLDLQAKTKKGVGFAKKSVSKTHEDSKSHKSKKKKHTEEADKVKHQA